MDTKYPNPILNELITNATPLPEYDRVWINNVNQYIYKHLKDSELSIPQLALYLRMSERQVYRRFKQVLRTTPNLYIRQVKLEIARHFLNKGTFETVNEVAFAVGYNRPDYFSDLFAKTFGKRPIEMLKNFQK